MIKLLYQLITFFFILSFAGWIFETTAVFLLQGQLTDRGLLFVSNIMVSEFSFFKKVPVSLPFVWGLPIIPIYGFGGIIMVYGFKNWHKKPILLIVVSMFAMNTF